MVAAYLECCNRSREAPILLNDARELGHRASETTKLLIDLLIRAGAVEEANRVLTNDHDLITAEEQDAVRSALV